MTDGVARIASDREVTRLGKNLLETHVLNQNSVHLSIRSIIKFKVKCDYFNVSRIIAVGTSALRVAEDSSHFLRTIKEKTGIDVTVISGEEEADLTLKGIRGQKSLFSAPCSIIIDVGGGSTEIIICNDQCTKASIPVGGVNLFERFIKCDPPSHSELNNIKDCLIDKFKPVLTSAWARAISHSCELIATGGTPATLASMYLNLTSYDGDKVHGVSLSYATIESMFEKLIALPLKERRNITGLEEQRADIILSGTMIVMTIMELLHAQELIVSDHGLMEGVLLEAGDFS
jgi:exopolyphosphatase/guanosine-5'-triphosphate,3'-diphosphate pyrophosphatase